MRTDVNNAIRLQYLQTMGIEVWIPRIGASVEQSLPVAKIETEIPVAVLPVLEASIEQQPIAKSEISVTQQWDELKAEVQNCTRCGLCNTRTQTVFGTGNQHADWLLIGEAPGQQEDEQGEPFVGVAGQLLTEMLRALGLEREQVFIANILKCRPPANRDPHSDEIKSCKDYWQRQYQLIQPKIILAVGRVAAQTLLNTDATVAKLRGRVHHYNNTPVVVVYHPAYLLRSLSEKRKAWQDLQLAKQTVIAMEQQ
jgi:uracil-DNA glycosylase family 4